MVAGIPKALGFVAGAFKALEFITGILKAQSPQLQHLPAKPLYMERLLKKGCKVLSLPKSVDVHIIPFLLFLYPPSRQEQRGAAEGAEALKLRGVHKATQTGFKRLFPVSPVANEGLYIEEYTCSTTRLCILQLTHDRFQAFG